MKDILLRHSDNYIECEIEYPRLTITYSDDPRAHYGYTLRDHGSYAALKRAVEDIFNSYEDPNVGYEQVWMFMQTTEINDFVVEGSSNLHFDPRTPEEIDKYMQEAEDKVWLMALCDISRKEPVHEVSRAAMTRILSAYDDIPKEGYSTWECGYWNGIMGALRWVVGMDKDFLDT